MKTTAKYSPTIAVSIALLVSPMFIAVLFSPALADPLLRENWAEAERARVAGFVSTLTGRLESPADRYQIPDGSGRNFYIDDRGALHFEPLYDGVAGNWRPVVPDVRNAPLYYSEAEALYKRGLKDEALYLMKALRAMAWIAREPDAEVDFALRSAMIREATRATGWLNRVQERDPEFDAVDRLSDPFVIFNGAAGRTVVVSNRFGWRMRLPGSWRFQRGRDRYSAQGDPYRNTVYLRHSEWRLTIASDVFMRASGRPLKIGAFVREWDLRRTLTPPRKRGLAFRRETIDEDLKLCDQPGRNSGQCRVFRTSLQDRSRAYRFREYYRLLAGQGRGLYLQFSYDLPASGAAAEIQEGAVDAALAKLIASLRITNR
ncbi:MAG: hypothetical protein NXI24_23645 [bacterium]|nr:hypothetical protein [bacterium]